MTTWFGGDDRGQAYRQAAQAVTQDLLRLARFAQVSDAGQAARGEREGPRDADGETGPAVEKRGGADQGEGEPGAGQTTVWYEGAEEPSWSWSGSQPLSHQTGNHLYLSTSCYHGDHGYCQAGVRGDGQAKRPAQCKFCEARCICSCHR